MLSFEFDKNAKHVNGLQGLGSRFGFCTSCSCFYFSSSYSVSSNPGFTSFHSLKESSEYGHGTKLGRKEPTLYCAFDLLPELLKPMSLKNFRFSVEKIFFKI